MNQQIAYIGTYTQHDSQGIYAISLDTKTGELKLQGLAAETVNPSFLAIHPNGRHVYAVNEVAEGKISAFERIGDSHQLKLLNQRPAGGSAPCHIVIDGSGKFVLVANYSSGSVSVTERKPDGELGSQTARVQHVGSSVNANRQASPHAHSVNLSLDNKFVYAADLGTDEMISYQFGEAGTLTRSSKLDMAKGAGPRHFALNPATPYGYVINELNSTITVVRREASTGELTAVQEITTLPRDFSGRSNTAEVCVAKNGKFVYGSNRGHDSIAVYRVEEDRLLMMIQIQKLKGKTPRNFVIDPTGRFLLAAAQASNWIEVFAIDESTGRLTPTEHSLEVPTPVCIRFMPR